MSDLDLQLWGTPSRASKASRKLRRQGEPSAMDQIHLGVVEAGRITGTVLDGHCTVMPAAPGKLAFGVELRVGREPMKRFAVVGGMPGMLRQAPKPEKGDATLRWNASPAEMEQMLAMANVCLEAEMPAGADPMQRRAFARDLVLRRLNDNSHVQGGVQAANAVACMVTWLIRTSGEARLVQWTPEAVGSAALIIWQTGHDEWNFRIEVTPAGAAPEMDGAVEPQAKPAVPEVLLANRKAILKLAGQHGLHNLRYFVANGGLALLVQAHLWHDLAGFQAALEALLEQTVKVTVVEAMGDLDERRRAWREARSL